MEKNSSNSSKESSVEKQQENNRATPEEEKLETEVEETSVEPSTGKFNQEPHYFKKFEFSRKKKVCIFRHLNRKCAKKGLAI